jgi:transposase-like protein
LEPKFARRISIGLCPSGVPFDPPGKLCAKFQISQSQYYKWRDQLPANGSKVFDYGGVDKSSERLLQEIQKLKRIIGDLTVELKKANTSFCKEEPCHEKCLEINELSKELEMPELLQIAEDAVLNRIERPEKH